MSYLDRVKLLKCNTCKKLLTANQSYRKNKYCGVSCMGISLRLPDPIGRMKAHNLKYRLKNKEKLRKDRFELVAKRKKMVYDLLGHFCKRCGFEDERALQIDHVNGFGLKTRNPRTTNTKHYYLVVYQSVLKNENKYQILCANCNWIKRHENKENSNDYKNGTHAAHMKSKLEAAVVLK